MPGVLAATFDHKDKDHFPGMDYLYFQITFIRKRKTCTLFKGLLSGFHVLTATESTSK